MNLPEEFKKIYKLVQHEPGGMIIEAIHDVWYRASDILTALSDERDKAGRLKYRLNFIDEARTDIMKKQDVKIDKLEAELERLRGEG